LVQPDLAQPYEHRHVAGHGLFILRLKQRSIAGASAYFAHEHCLFMGAQKTPERPDRDAKDGSRLFLATLDKRKLFYLGNLFFRRE
jgi:hypothetical protein